MKRIIQLLLLLAAITPGIGYANYLRDIDYRVIPQQPVTTGSKIEVREFFWYGCPHPCGACLFYLPGAWDNQQGA